MLVLTTVLGCLANTTELYGTNMKIELNINDVSDELYNMLLMELLTKATTEGMDLVKGTKVEDWKISAEVLLPNKVH